MTAAIIIDKHVGLGIIIEYAQNIAYSFILKITGCYLFKLPVIPALFTRACSVKHRVRPIEL